MKNTSYLFCKKLMKPSLISGLQNPDFFPISGWREGGRWGGGIYFVSRV